MLSYLYEGINYILSQLNPSFQITSIDTNTGDACKVHWRYVGQSQYPIHRPVSCDVTLFFDLQMLKRQPEPTTFSLHLLSLTRPIAVQNRVLFVCDKLLFSRS